MEPKISIVTNDKSIPIYVGDYKYVSYKISPDLFGELSIEYDDSIILVENDKLILKEGNYAMLAFSMTDEFTIDKTIYLDFDYIMSHSEIKIYDLNPGMTSYAIYYLNTI